MNGARRVAEAVRKRLRDDRARLKVPQEKIATDGDIPRGTVAYVDGKDSRHLSLATFVGYARGLYGRPAWKALRDAEETIFGDE